MGCYIDLLTSLPKSKRDVKARSDAKDPEVIKKAKQFGYEYFDGDRKYGYGGYYYDGRWRSVARDLIDFFSLKKGAKILDIGCAKGYLVRDLITEGGMLDVYGVDISTYALNHCDISVAHRLQKSSAEELPFEDKSFDLVISINTIHNLPHDGVIQALKEIERVSRGNSYVVVDAYYTEEEKRLFQSWCLTAETYGYPEQWLSLFKEAGYSGYYSFNVL